MKIAAWISLCIVLLAAAFVLLLSLVCFLRVFYVPKRKKRADGEYNLPRGRVYEPHKEAFLAWIKAGRELPHEDVAISSFDGLTLRGRYYPCETDHPENPTVELLFHGYRGNAERDLSAGIERCFALGRSVILINQRAGGESDGRVTSFGINERRDCLRWVDYAIERFGTNVKLILSGISMGAATVVMTAGEPLPNNVVCILSDCGFTSAKEIICKTVGEMGLPVRWVYPFIRLGARIFGRFDLEQTTPLEAVRRCRTPILFIHGDTDDFVPLEMSRRLWEACPAKKKFVTIPGAGHAVAYPVNKDLYLSALKEFQEECGFRKTL